MWEYVTSDYWECFTFNHYAVFFDSEEEAKSYMEEKKLTGCPGCKVVSAVPYCEEQLELYEAAHKDRDHSLSFDDFTIARHGGNRFAFGDLP